MENKYLKTLIVFLLIKVEMFALDFRILTLISLIKINLGIGL